MTNIKLYKVLIQESPESLNYIDYSNNLQLPFSINENVDERYDTGSIILHKLEREEPFDSELKVKIQIYDQGILINEYSMCVEDDNVKTFYLGIRKYYNHTIQLIELTKKLDKLFLPDFTITNPATKTIVKSFEATETNWQYTPADVSGSKYRKSVNMNRHDADQNYMGYSNFEYYIENTINNNPQFKSNLTINQSKFQLNNSEIELMIPYADSVVTLNSRESVSGGRPTYTAGYIYDKTYTNDITREVNSLSIKYSYKSGTSTTFSDILTLNTSNDGKTVKSFVIHNNNRVRNKNNKFYFYMYSKEKITIKIDVIASISSSIIRSNTTTSVKNFSNNNYVQTSSWQDLVHIYEAAQNGLSYFFENSGLTTDTQTGNRLNMIYATLDLEEASNKDEALRAATDWASAFASVFHNIDYNIENAKDGPGTYTSIQNKTVILGSFQSQFESISSLEGVVEETIGYDGYKTIQNVLEKINTILDPSDRFLINLDQKDILNTTVPERIYSKRNVSEILFELGTLVSAYPYLNTDNILTFNKIVSKDNPDYSDYNTEENVSYTSENAVNSYITNVSNMISIPDSYQAAYSYWPSKDEFGYPNGNWKNKSITPDTNQIEISNSSGIYYLKYIKVKNCLKTVSNSTGGNICDPTTVIDITNFCPEESYYNTLYVQGQVPSSNTNKSNCIYWTKGSNIINLDALEAAEKSAIWGTEAPVTYKIKRAILYAAQVSINPTIVEGNLLEDTTKYQFQICYLDSMDGLIKTKKFNQENLNEIISNYNQTDNNISAQDWLNTSQINVLRRGNTELDKVVYIRDFTKLPKIGEIKYNNTERYLADAINYTFDNRMCGVSMNYTKSYNKIDPSVTISKDYRQYEIYGKEAVTRDINIDRYLYLDYENKGGTISHRYNLTGAFKSGSRNKCPKWFLVFFKDADHNPISYYRMNTSGKVEKETANGILIPINFTSSGNTVIFQGSLLDNYAAGYYQNHDENLPYIDIFGNNQPSGSKTLKEVRYVDDLGEAEYMSVYVLGDTDGTIFNQSIFPSTNITSETEDLKNKSVVLDYESDIQIKKDNREKINIIYQIHYLTHETEIKWNPAICKYMFYDHGAPNYNQDYIFEGTGNNPTYYALKYNMSNDLLLPQASILNTETNIVEYKEDPTKVYKTDIIPNPTGSSLISNTSLTASDNLYGLALVYPKNKEVIFHIDKSIKSGESYTPKTIYFNLYKNRI